VSFWHLLGRVGAPCVLLLLGACGRPETAGPQATPTNVNSTFAGDAGVCRVDLSPCDRIEQRQRASIQAGDASSARTPSVFRRCFFAEGGAVGLVPERSRDESRAFRVVFEARDGSAVVSERHEYQSSTHGARPADPPLDALVFPRSKGSAAPVTFVKFRSELRPIPLGAPLPVQTGDFFSPISPTRGRDAGQRTTMAYSWADLEGVDAGGYRLGFRLPGLAWKEGRAFGGTTERELHGVDAFVLLDVNLDLAANEDLRGAVKHACATAPSADGASPSQLWTAAQCERVRGEPIAAILKRIARRCDALARQALPHSIALFSMSARGRDGHPSPFSLVEETSARLALVDPPSACFSNDHLWNVDYTARASPPYVPKVELDAAWNEGLVALGDWPQ
jgi:hypothetical protein